MTPAGVISFGDFRDAFANHEDTLRALIERNACRDVCEIGGGAAPALSGTYLAAHQLRYTVVDISADELRRAPAGYVTIVADICAETLPPAGPFDLVFSKMLAEHVRAPATFHRNVHRLLRPGGLAFHFFPTLYALPFVINRLLPERLAAFALQLVAPRDPMRHAKFPAFYRWCRGPRRSQRRRFERLGYTIESYVGFFGHGYYDRLPVLGSVQRAFARALARRPIAALTSFAYVVLRKGAAN